MGISVFHPDNSAITEQYWERVKVSRDLRALRSEGLAEEFTRLAVAIDNVHANYSARDHNHGPRIFPRNTRLVFSLAKAITADLTGPEMLDLVYGAEIPYLKVSIGSEMAMMLHPEAFMVVNTRTLWTMQLYESGWRVGDASRFTMMMIDKEASELDYKLWRSLYAKCVKNVRLAAQELTARSKLGGKRVDTQSNLWADAVSNHLYEKHAQIGPAFRWD